MSDRLTMYNLALLYCGERALASLTENAEARRVLDTVWNANGVKKCLEEGQWRFATRSIQIDYDPDIDPGIGYSRAFPHPSDWCTTVAVSLDEYFREPLLDYTDEGLHWYADHDTLYIRYVSDDDGYGLNINDWPGWFEEFVAMHFASRVVLKITGSREKLADVLKLREKAKLQAINRDMMAEPTRFPPAGAWNRARWRRTSRGDRGNMTGNLY